MKTRVALGVDLGGTHLSSALVDLAKHEIIDKTVCRNSYAHTEESDQILNSWVNNLEQTLNQLKEDHQLLGIGVAMPGPFDYKNGVSKMQQKMVALYDKNIATALNLKLDENYSIRFLNDASCFAIGESMIGHAKEHSKIVVLTLGTGFGSAFIENSIPIVTRSDAPPEGCLWHLDFKEGIGDNYFSTGWFVNRYKELSGKKIKGVKELLMEEEAIPYAYDILEEFGENLGEFIGPWLKKFDAEILVIGGNIAKAIDHFILPMKDSFSRQHVELQIVSSELMEEAAIIGAAKLFDEDFWPKVSETLPNI